MKYLQYSILTVSLALFAIGCSSTYNSAMNAQIQQQGQKRAALSDAEARGASLGSTRSQLEAKLSSKQRELESLRSQLPSAGSGAGQIQGRIQAMEIEINNYRRQLLTM